MELSFFQESGSKKGFRECGEKKVVKKRVKKGGLKNLVRIRLNRKNYINFVFHAPFLLDVVGKKKKGFDRTWSKLGS